MSKWLPVKMLKPFAHGMFSDDVLFCAMSRRGRGGKVVNAPRGEVVCDAMWVGHWHDYSGYTPDPEFNRQPTHWRSLPKPPGEA